MHKNYIYTIGLMSGTSLDGVDLAYVKINKNKYSDFELLQATTISYSGEWKMKLKKAIFFPDEELVKINDEYALLLSTIINEFVDEYKIDKLDFIASHGHTVLHQPEKGVTLQIGNGQIIANETNHKVICDFRTQDVKLGGQGAPLVPIGDKLLFSDYDYCLNLGGFANVSYQENTKRIAFDICPVNIVLNHYVEKMNLAYDDEGKIAAGGKINNELLLKLNSLSFYSYQAPKSLGLEWVQSNILPLIDKEESSIENILRTFVEHIAMQIGSVLQKGSSILATGGGVFNKFLISRIAYYASNKITIPTKMLIDYKEALIFSLLGVLKDNNEINCLQSVTGAKKDHSSGVVFYPQN
ncbi:MAG: anhydro-N-acetylmuramic acid kinase [Tenacibaculum sp.]